MKESGKLSIILGSHAHVPSGAGESEFEYVYENVLRPFVSALYRYSNIQAVLHYSGVLLYWVERTHPEFFMLIEDMVSRKQAEILSGGFYEPIFPIIPLQDRIGQIELLTTYLRRHFGKRPMGCWIPGLAWEQHLCAALAASDMNYTFLSQEQFLNAGLGEKDIFYPCITEDQGKLITVFPVSFKISSMLAEKSLSQVLVEFAESMEEKKIPNADSIVSVFPEKILTFPNETREGAWNRFFEELSLSKNIADAVLPGKIFKHLKINNKASFPNSSFVNGSGSSYSPRRYLIENCEASGIYSKMIFINVLISQLKGDKSRKQNAREELWKAQDSCLFIPGTGYDKTALRKFAYSSLLRAERLSREKGNFVSSLIQHDFNLDGKKEYLFQDTNLNCYIRQKGAGIFELDYLVKEWNYLNCGCGDYGKRLAFADVIIPEHSIIEGNKYPEKSRLLFSEQYEILSQDRKGKCCFKSAETGNDKNYGNIEAEKCYLIKRDSLSVNYILKNNENQNESFIFASEINLSFDGYGEEYVKFFSVNKEENGKDEPVHNIINNTESLKILDIKNETQLLLSSSIPFSGQIIPVFKDNCYQASRIILQFRVTLKNAEIWTNTFNLKFSC